MTKSRSVAFTLCISFVLCMLSACGSQKASPSESAGMESSVTSSATETSTAPTEPEQHYTFFAPDEMTDKELDNLVVEQGNRHNLNAFAYDTSWIYGPWHGENYTGEIVKVRYDNTDWTVIDEDTNRYLASCQAIKSGYLYYSRVVADGKAELIKVRASGEEAKVIIPEHNGSIQIVGNLIYYTTKETQEIDGKKVTQDSSHLYRCDLNGENVEAVLEKPVYYFTVFGEKILYQDDKDNATLHIYNMTSDENVRINDVRSFWPIFDGEYIYYLTDNANPDSYQHKLWRMTSNGIINEEVPIGCTLNGYLLRGDYIYYINKDDNSRIYRCLKNGSNVELVTQDDMIGEMQFINNSIAYTRYDEDGHTILGIYLCDPDGSDKVEFAHSDGYWHLG